MRILNKRGQNMAEYSILIALIIAAAIGVKTYVQRGVQARIRDEADAFGDKLKDAPEWASIPSAADATFVRQFEDEKLSKVATTATSMDKEDYTLEKTGKTSKEITKTTSQAAQDYEQYGAPTQ